MAQAGRSRGRNGRKKKPGMSLGLIDLAKDVRVVSRIRSGVVEGAEAETCGVCGKPSEGWMVVAGKKRWHHFGRSFDCVEKVAHIEALPEV